MLGYTNTDWSSVLVPEMPPRDGLDAILGGYRRIPVAQHGADIYCDTRLISAELAYRAEQPELHPGYASEATLGLPSALEGDVFWASVASIPARRIISQLLRNISLLGTFRFIRDRAGVARNANTRPMRPSEAKAVFAAHLRALDARLADHGPFLGGSRPDYLDFAAYHTFWFQCVVGELPMPQGKRALMSWYESMRGIGHGQSSEIDVETACQSITKTAPEALPAESEADAQLGESVTVRPMDYALDGTQGRLMAQTAERWIISRDTKWGAVHVHFPRDGFELIAQQA